jgi:hypothetical protein
MAPKPQLDCFLKWSQVPIEPVADGERRIDAGKCPSAFDGRFIAYSSAIANANWAGLPQPAAVVRPTESRWLTRRNGVPAALRPFTLRQEQSRHDENVSRTRLRCHRGTSD